MRKTITRAISLVLAAVMVFTSVDLSAFAAEYDSKMNLEAENLKEELRNMVSDEEHPNGVFELAHTMITMSEGEDGTISVVRAGNTDKQASVVFKAVDISAVYGQDYTLSVERSFFGDETLEANPDTVPLLQAYGEVAGAQVSAETDVDPEIAEEVYDSIQKDAAAEEDEAVTDEVIVEDNPATEESAESISEDDTEAVVEETATDPADSQKDDAQTDEEDVELSGSGSALTNAYEAQTGESARFYDWREYNEKDASEEDVENLNASNEQAKEYLAMLEGVTVKLNLKKGEYRKDIKISVIDDDKSESDEQVLIVLQDAVNSEIGENYNGYINITDNDEKEDVIYSVKEKEITAGSDDSYVTVTIERTSGVDRMDIVTVGTQAVDAEADVNYEVTRTDVLFAPGVTERTVDVRIFNSSRTEERHFYIGVKSESGQVEDTANSCLVTLLPTSDNDNVPTETVMNDSDEVEALGLGWDIMNSGIFDNAKIDRIDQKDLTTWGGDGDVNGSDSRYDKPYNDKFIDASDYDYILFDIECWGNTYHWWRSNTTNKTFHLQLFSFTGSHWPEMKHLTQEIEGDQSYGPGSGSGKKTEHFQMGIPTKDLPGDLSRINVHPWVQAGSLSENVDMWCRINYICLIQMPCEIRVENTNSNNYYREKQWTGPDTYNEIGNKIRYPLVYLDKGKLLDEGEGVISDDIAVYHTGDSVSATQETNPTAANSLGVKASSDVLELKGFKVMRQGANHLLSEEVLPLNFKIDMNFKKKWYNGDYLFKGDNYDRIVLVPYYVPKTATVRFTNPFKEILTENGEERIQGGYNNFDESTVLKDINKLDTIKVTTFAETPSAVTRVTLSGKQAGDGAVISSTGRDSSQNTPATTLITHVGDRDLVDYQFGIEYDTTLLKIMPDPKYRDFEDIKKGSIVYVPKGGTAVAAEGGESLEINDVNMYESYNIGAITDDAYKNNYKVVWRDGTLDKDDSGEWVENNNNYTTFVPSAGNSISYTTKLPKSRIYYSFVPKTTAQLPAPIVGWLELEDKLLISGVTKSKPIDGATVYADADSDDDMVTTSKGTYKGVEGNGFYKLEKDTYSVQDNYLVTITYTGPEGSINTAVNQIPGRAQKIAVKTYEDLDIDNVILSQGKVVDAEANPVEIEYTAKVPTTDSTGYFTGWTNGDHIYRIQMTPSASAVKIDSGILEFYDKNGLYVTKVEGVKNPKTGEFTFDFNPAQLPLTKIIDIIDKETGKKIGEKTEELIGQIDPGATLAVKFKDNNGHEYMRREVGIELRQTMGTKDVINMFIGGKDTTMNLLGKVDMLLDLGWSGDFDDLDADDAGNKVLAIGFNQDIVNKDSEKKSVDKELKDLSDAEQAKADKQKNLQGVMDKYSGEKANSDEAKKEMEKAIKEVEEAEKERLDAQKKFDEDVGKATKPNTKNTKLGGKVEMSFDFSFMMTFAYDTKEAKYYFQDMVLTAALSGSAEGSVEFATPIGVTVTITLSLSGSAKATFVVQTRGENDSNKRVYVLKDQGSINIWDFDQKDDNRQNDAWGAFEFTPTIALSVKAGILGDLISVKVEGSAAFNLVVYAGLKDKDAGKVRLHAGLEVKVIVATFKIDFVNKDFPLYGSAENIENLGSSVMDALEGNNILYEPASGFESEDVSYMAGGSDWYGNDEEDIFALGADTSNPSKFIEKPLADKIGTDPSFDLAYLGNGIYAGVYLDVPADRVDDRDNSRAAYSTYYDGSKWATPKILEEDSTLDAAPNIFSLGERGAVIIWSSSSYQETDDTDVDPTIAKLNSLDLHAKLINKDGSLDDKLLEITKSTTDANASKYETMGLDWGDISSDVSPVVAYNDNKMIVYYQKKYYEASGNEAVVGDVLYPTITLMAYRSYDFTTSEWDDAKITADDIVSYVPAFNGLTEKQKEERVAAYNECYYGQRFLPSLPNVIVIDDIDEATGYRREGTEPKTFTSKRTPLILDASACSYDNYGVFAYSIDADGNLKTTADREIYLQTYSFEEGVMSDPVILTGDEVSDTNVDLVRLNDSTWLSWLRDGNIVSTNLTYFADFWEDTLIKKDGYYIIDKTKPENVKAGIYVPPVLIVEGEKAEFDENADRKSESDITSFQAEGNGDKIYYIWSKNGTALKDGIEEDSAEAENPANLVVERQLYSARAQMNKADYEGMPITYVEDITLPIQLTDQNGMNYDYVSFDIEENGNATGLVWKAPSVTETKDGATYPVVDTISAEPMSFKIEKIGTAEIKNAEFTAAQAGDVALFSFDVLNDGFDTLENLTVTAVDKDGKSVLTITEADEDGIATDQTVGSITIGELRGGHTQSFRGQFDLDEDATEAKATITLTDSTGTVVRTLDITEKLEAYVVFDEIKAEPTDIRGIYHVSGTVTNLGTAKSGNNSKMALGYRNEAGEFVQVGDPYGYDQKLAPGESVELAADLEIPDEYFVVNSETDADGNVNVTETCTVVVMTDRDTYAETVIERTANSDEINTVKAIKSMTLNNGKALSFSQSDIGNSIALSPQVESELERTENGYDLVEDKKTGDETLQETKVKVTGAENLRYRYEVVDADPEDAVSVDDEGILTVNKTGGGKIRVSAFYSDGTLQAYNASSGSDRPVSSTTLDDFVNLAQDAVYTVEIPFSVSNRTDSEKMVAGGLVYYYSNEDKTTVTCAGLDDSNTTASKVTIPASVKIGDKTCNVDSIDLIAFSGNNSITSVTIGKNVKTIGVQAFKGCTALKSVTFGAGVTEIQEGAFEGCTSLQTVAPKDALTTIGKNAFKGCTSLTTVTIPKNVTTIGDYAFADCESLKKINVKSTALADKGITEYSFADVPKDCEFTVSGSKEYVAEFQKKTTRINDTFTDKRGVKYAVSEIGSNTVEVAGVSFTEATAKKGVVTIPATVKYKGITYAVTGIDANAFDDDDKKIIKKVTIGKNVTEIEEGAFEDCTSLTTVKIPANVKTIGEDTFKGCTSLKTATIGKNVTTIGESAFEGCTSLTAIKIPANVTDIKEDAFKGCTAAKKVTFGKNLKNIGESAFEGCTKLTAIVIPANVETIAKYAFRDCSAVKTLTIKSAKLVSIGTNAFDGIMANATVKISVKNDLKAKVAELLTSAVGITETMTIK